MTLTKLQPIQDIGCPELSPKPTFRKPEASQKLQDLESHPGSWGWRQHIPTCSSNPHLHCFPSATKCEADKFICLISSIFLGCYRSYKHFWHNTPIFGNATACSLAGKASLMCKALHTCTDWTHQDVTQSVGLLVLKQGFPPLLLLTTLELTLQERSECPF